MHLLKANSEPSIKMTRSAHQWSPHAFCQFSGPQYVRRHVQGLSGTRHRVRPLRHHADRQGCKELFALCPPSSNLIMYFFFKLIREKVFKNLYNSGYAVSLSLTCVYAPQVHNTCILVCSVCNGVGAYSCKGQKAQVSL